MRLISGRNIPFFGLYGFINYQTPIVLHRLSTILNGRIGWAKTYSVQAGLVTQPKRGLAALIVMKSNNHYLKKLPDFIAFQQRVNKSTANENNNDKSPNDGIMR